MNGLFLTTQIEPRNRFFFLLRKEKGMQRTPPLPSLNISFFTKSQYFRNKNLTSHPSILPDIRAHSRARSQGGAHFYSLKISWKIPTSWKLRHKLELRQAAIFAISCKLTFRAKYDILIVSWKNREKKKKRKKIFFTK